jgi:hypothetical protein
MNINVHIERLVLDGIAIPAHQRPLLQAATEAELARLLAINGLAPHLLSGGAMPHVPVGSIQLAAGSKPAQLGQQIAQAVYGGIGHNPKDEARPRDSV